MRFELGAVVVTRNAASALNREDVLKALERHARGDWGFDEDLASADPWKREAAEEDWAANDNALRSGGRVLSVYHDRSGRKFYVITEADRSVTTALLPEDY